MASNFNLELLYNLNDNLLPDNICPISIENTLSLLQRKNKIQQKQRYNISDDLWDSTTTDSNKIINYNNYLNNSELNLTPKEDIKICGHFCSLNGHITTINIMHQLHKNKIYHLLNIDSNINEAATMQNFGINNFSILTKQNKIKTAQFLNNNLIPSLFMKEIEMLYILVLGRDYQGYVGNRPVFIQNHNSNNNDAKLAKEENIIFNEMENYPDPLGMVNGKKIEYKQISEDCISENSFMMDIAKNINKITNYDLKIECIRIFSDYDIYNPGTLQNVIKFATSKSTFVPNSWIHIQYMHKE